MGQLQSLCCFLPYTPFLIHSASWEITDGVLPAGSGAGHSGKDPTE